MPELVVLHAVDNDNKLLETDILYYGTYRYFMLVLQLVDS